MEETYIVGYLRSPIGYHWAYVFSKDDNKALTEEQDKKMREFISDETGGVISIDDTGQDFEEYIKEVLEVIFGDEVDRYLEEFKIHLGIDFMNELNKKENPTGAQAIKLAEKYRNELAKIPRYRLLE